MNDEWWGSRGAVGSWETRSRTWGWQLKATEVLEPLGGLRRGSRVLEIGPGDGCLWRLARSRLDESTYVTLDISMAVLTGLQEGGRRARPLPVRADMISLPFLDRSFDALISISTFMYCASGRQTAAEWVRVLASGGKLAMIDANRHLLKPRTAREPEAKDLLQVSRWFEDAGLSIDQSRWLSYAPGRPRILWPLYDAINAVCPRIPFVRRLAGTYLVAGTRR